MAKETYLHGKRDLLTWQKRPTYMAKETYLPGKRDLLTWQKRPNYMSQVPCKLLTKATLKSARVTKECQKRPEYLAKETY